MDMRSNCGADRAGMHLNGANMAPGREFVLVPMLGPIDPYGLPEVEASWSNRNGGEILVTVGSLRMTVSEALARLAHAKLGAALAVPDKAAAMAAKAPRRELERVAEAAASIVEPLTERRAQLCKTVPHRETRLSAVREAIACCANEGCDAAHICKIPFTAEELADIEAGLEIGAAGAIGSDAC